MEHGELDQKRVYPIIPNALHVGMSFEANQVTCVTRSGESVFQKVQASLLQQLQYMITSQW